MTIESTEDGRLGAAVRCVLSGSTTGANLAFAAVVEGLGLQDAPETIGRFSIVRRLGSGAMGVVFLARDPTLERLVAVKLLRPGRDDEVAHSRLLKEGQALAKLRHPNVVAVHEMGLDDGRPFVAMEYVEGQSVREWLDGRRRPVSEVLRVFCEAAEGLAAAHQSGIVHRDFKPDNVLVDDDGRVQVADFGLARALEGLATAPEGSDVPAGDAATAHTARGAIVGTPAYLAPEIYEGGDASEASDQFSFCVSLYEGLYGQRPFRGRTLPSLAAAIVDGTLAPPPPGRAVPRHVVRALARGMSVAPSDRWSGMAALVQALRHDPARRVRVAVAVAGPAAIAASVAAFAALRSGPQCEQRGSALPSTWGPTQRHILTEAFHRTNKPEASEHLSAALEGLDAYARAWRDSATEACQAAFEREPPESAEMFARRMQCLDARRIELAAAVEVLGEVDARTLRRTQAVVEGLTPIAACADTVALTSRLPLPDAPRARQTVLAFRARLVRVRSLISGGHRQRAEELMTRLDAEPQPRFDPLLAEIEFTRAALHEVRGRFDAANESLRIAFTAAQRAGDTRLAAAAAVFGIHVAAGGLYDPVEARRWAWLAEPLVAQVEGEPRMVAALWMHRVGVELLDGDVEAAIDAGQKSIAAWAESKGPVSVELGDAQLNLAIVYRRAKNFDRALAVLREAEATIVAAAGPAHPTLADIANSSGVTYLELNQLDAAEAAFELALERFDAVSVGGRARGGMALNNLGEVAARKGQHVLALERFEAGLARFREFVPDDHPWVADALSLRGRSELALGRHAAALASLRKAVAILETQPAGVPPEVQAALLRAQEATSQ